MTDLPQIDPALGLDLVRSRTLDQNKGPVSVIIPAHNEAETIVEVVTESLWSLKMLGAQGEVIVSASACTDETAELATKAGARVVISPAGKGNALKEGFRASTGEIICLVDGDIRYFGDQPLAAILLKPILLGTADATITDLYWRPLYPQMWLHAFFAPLAGLLYPEMLPKTGSTPWSGQRAALRHLWPPELPDGFTVDLEILLHWNTHALRLRPILADDWVNPQRPKTDLMAQELQVLIRHALADHRLEPEAVPAVERWFELIHRTMATYEPGKEDPQRFERMLLSRSTTELQRQLSLTPTRPTTVSMRPQSRPPLAS